MERMRKKEIFTRIYSLEVEGVDLEKVLERDGHTVLTKNCLKQPSILKGQRQVWNRVGTMRLNGTRRTAPSETLNI